LFVGLFADATLNVWLKETLSSLNLYEGFLNRVLDSTQKTVTRVLRAGSKAKLEHIHLLVLVPSNRSSKKQTWGFFSVERLEEINVSDAGNDHAIEIYLYLEGNDTLPHGNQ
jgi:hypothetical protein